LPRDFFQYGTPELARNNIAPYVAKLRPEITDDEWKRGQDRFPTELFGLGRILAWSDQDPDVLTPDEEALARTLSRIAAYYRVVVSQNADQLAKVAGADLKGRLFGGPDYNTAKGEAEKAGANARSLLFYELGNLVISLRSLASEAEPVVRVLKRHKLGLEFTAPDCRKQLRAQNEKALQRCLRKYLVDHGIYSFGTDFGKGQADAFIESHPDSYVVEVKMFDKRPPSERSVRKALVQLQTYMDMVPGPRKGILVLYCFQEPLVTEPTAWLHGRYWILPVNLQSAPPSGQEHSLSVTESDDPRELIKVRLCRDRLREALLRLGDQDPATVPEAPSSRRPIVHRRTGHWMLARLRPNETRARRVQIRGMRASTDSSKSRSPGSERAECPRTRPLCPRHATRTRSRSPTRPRKPRSASRLFYPPNRLPRPAPPTAPSARTAR